MNRFSERIVLEFYDSKYSSPVTNAKTSKGTYIDLDPLTEDLWLEYLIRWLLIYLDIL